MVVNCQGIPVAIQILPGALHDLTPMFEITTSLPKDSTLLGDKAYSCEPVESALKELGVTLMSSRKKNQKTSATN